MHREFEAFFRGIPFYGLAVACIDHPVVSHLIERLQLRRDGRRLLTYGTTPGADLVLQIGARGGRRDRLRRPARPPRARRAARVERLEHPAAPATTMRSTPWRRSPRRARPASPTTPSARRWPSFSGVKRRFQLTGTWNGVAVYDDYGHHPVEIAAVLKAARAGARGRVVAVVEPHRYTRVRDLFHEFAAQLRRRRLRHRRPALHRRRGAHRRRHQRGAGRGDPRQRPQGGGRRRQRARDRPAAAARRGGRRHGRVPRRRQQHGMGARAAGVARAAGPVARRGGAA